MYDESSLKPVGEYLIGLIWVGAIAVLLGIYVNGMLVVPEGTFSALGVAIAVAYIIPVITAVFGLIALATRVMMFCAYPIAAYALTAVLKDTAVVSWLASIAPIQPRTDPQYLTNAVTVFLSYVTVHSIAWPIRGLIRARDEDDYERAQAATVGNATVLGCAALALIALPFLAPPIDATKSKTYVKAAVPPAQLPANMERDENGDIWVVNEDGEIPEYEAVGWFEYPDWDIEFPVTEDMRGLYISSRARNAKQFAIIGSNELGESDCVHDHALLMLDQLEYPDEGTVFSLEPAPNPQGCETEAGFLREAELRSQIEWASARIRRTD